MPPVTRATPDADPLPPIGGRENSTFGRAFVIGGGVALFLFAISIIFGSWYTIDQTERGVLLRNGAFVAVVQPGLHFKLPWLESVYKIDMQTHKFEYTRSIRTRPINNPLTSRSRSSCTSIPARSLRCIRASAGTRRQQLAAL